MKRLFSSLVIGWSSPCLWSPRFAGPIESISR